MHTYFPLVEKTFYEIHLLLFAKNFLMLPSKLSNIHAHLQSTLPTYLNIHTHLQGIFATYLNIHTYLQGILTTYLLHFEWHFLLYVPILRSILWIMHCFDDVEKKSLDCHHQKGGECECMNT